MGFPLRLTIRIGRPIGQVDIRIGDHHRGHGYARPIRIGVAIYSRFDVVFHCGNREGGTRRIRLGCPAGIGPEQRVHGERTECADHHTFEDRMTLLGHKSTLCGIVPLTVMIEGRSIRDGHRRRVDLRQGRHSGHAPQRR